MRSVARIILILAPLALDFAAKAPYTTKQQKQVNSMKLDHNKEPEPALRASDESMALRPNSCSPLISVLTSYMIQCSLIAEEKAKAKLRAA